MKSPRTWFVVIVAVTIVLLSIPLSAANGGKARNVQLTGELPTNSGRCNLSADIDPWIFAITTVAGKYRVIRIRIVCPASETVTLAKASDKAMVRTGGQLKPAILDLAGKEPEFWDSRAPDVRRAIAYPQRVEPGEEESIFVFIEATEPSIVPEEIDLTIGGKTAHLGHAAAAKS